jgi:hypothetical protein
MQKQQYKMNNHLSIVIEKIKRGQCELLTISGEVSLNGATRLGNALKGNHSVRTLSLNSCKIGDAQVKAIASALKDCHIKTLYLGVNQISIGGAKALQELLPLTNHLTTLSLYSNKLRDEGAEVIAQALRTCSITSIDLGANEIGFRGIQAISLGIQGSRLKDLFLAENSLLDEHVMELSKGITNALHLECLDLKLNLQISDESVELALLPALQAHPSMNSVILIRTGVSEASCSQLEQHFRILHSKKATLMTTLLAASSFPRVGRNSPCRYLSTDLIRTLINFLEFDDNK